jgi:hypothetical protein
VFVLITYNDLECITSHDITRVDVRLKLFLSPLGLSKARGKTSDAVAVWVTKTCGTCVAMRHYKEIEGARFFGGGIARAMRVSRA